MVGSHSHALEEIARRHRLADIYVFGSRANEIANMVRGDAPGVKQHDAADVDIGVRPLPGARLHARQRVRITLELEDLFDAGRVDLVVLPEAGPFLARDIIAGELLYCADRHDQCEYELYVLRRAG
ncbi:MAG TPA: nucleotidyltransferase domain-containing protein, partial [Longimicrobiales bacterium]|nr:nucleotidyltransferase domain-containing protein [Longimicrobiales bacterium]